MSNNHVWKYEKLLQKHELTLESPELSEDWVEFVQNFKEAQAKETSEEELAKLDKDLVEKFTEYHNIVDDADPADPPADTPADPPADPADPPADTPAKTSPNGEKGKDLKGIFAMPPNEQAQKNIKLLNNWLENDKKTVTFDEMVTMGFTPKSNLLVTDEIEFHGFKLKQIYLFKNYRLSKIEAGTPPKKEEIPANSPEQA